MVRFAESYKSYNLDISGLSFANIVKKDGKSFFYPTDDWLERNEVVASIFNIICSFNFGEVKDSDGFVARYGKKGPDHNIKQAAGDLRNWRAVVRDEGDSLSDEVDVPSEDLVTPSLRKEIPAWVIANIRHFKFVDSVRDLLCSDLQDNVDNVTIIPSHMSVPVHEKGEDGKRVKVAESRIYMGSNGEWQEATSKSLKPGDSVFDLIQKAADDGSILETITNFISASPELQQKIAECETREAQAGKPDKWLG